MSDAALSSRVKLALAIGIPAAFVGVYLWLRYRDEEQVAAAAKTTAATSGVSL